MTERVKAGTSRAQAEQRRKLFVEAYVTNGGNGTQAAISAGWPQKSAHVRAAELVKDSKVSEAIAARQAHVLGEAQVVTGLTVERTLREVARLAYFDGRKLFDKDGVRIPIHKLDDDTAAAIGGVEIDELTAGQGKDKIVLGNTTKVKVFDKNSALDKAMKHFGLYERDNEQQPPAVLIPGVKTVKFAPFKGRPARAS